jgi:hypothetical protein
MAPLVEGKELKYMYRGTTGKNVFNGCGYATVNFTEAGMTRGHGHFIEETAIKERKESRYMKLTPDTMEEIFGRKNVAFATKQNEIDLIKTFTELDNAKREQIIRTPRTTP